MSEMEEDQEELDQISTIALLIDDLSSEDPNAKLHSIVRLKAIAALLGAERTATELVPMLTELIDKIDCNPELMMHLAVQLGSLTDILGASEYIAQLLEPLEVMVGNDDSVVRDKAIESMRKVAKLLEPDTQLREMYLPLLKRQRKGDLFSMRISACFLYADIYQSLRDEDLKAMVRKKFTKLSKDDTPMVRRGAAQSISIITQSLEHEHAVDFLLPICKALLEDQNDAVKIHAVQSSINVAKAVQDSMMIRDSIVPSFKTASENRHSWRLRFTVAEHAAQLSAYVSKQAVDQDIVGLYELLLRDSEAEVRSEAIAQVPEVAKHCTSQVLIDQILPILKEQMANDSSQHVKGSMAQAICDLASNLEREDIINYILPAVVAIMKDSVTEVRVSLMQNIKKLALAIDEQNVEKLIIPEIVKLSKDNTWRVRLATIQFCPTIPQFVSPSVFTEHIEPLLKGWLEDTVHSVRVETVNCLIQLKTEQFNTSWLENLLEEKLDDLYQHKKFGLRIHTFFAINLLFKEVTDQFLNDKLYKKYMSKLGDDPVPNIRFNYAKTATLLYHKLTNKHKIMCTDTLKRLAENDKDFDVKFYSSKAISELKI